MQYRVKSHSARQEDRIRKGGVGPCLSHYKQKQWALIINSKETESNHSCQFYIVRFQAGVVSPRHRSEISSRAGGVS